MLRTMLMAGLVLAAAPALAQEDCTEAKAEELSQQLFEIVSADPDKAGDLETAIAEVEAEYGGEPPESEVCNALEQVIAKIAGEG